MPIGILHAEQRHHRLDAAQLRLDGANQLERVVLLNARRRLPAEIGVPEATRRLCHTQRIPIMARHRSAIASAQLARKRPAKKIASMAGTRRISRP